MTFYDIYDVCHLLTFVAYDVHHIMTFVSYDVCCIMRFVGNDDCHIMMFVAYDVFECVAYRVCRSAVFYLVYVQCTYSTVAIVTDVYLLNKLKFSPNLLFM